MMKVKHFSYSTLSELESLSKLTALTLSECSEDVIYRELSLSSKLTQYTLTVGEDYKATSSMDDYDKNIALKVFETAPLGDWICQLLKKSELVHSTGKGSNNVLTELQLNKLQNVKCLSLFDCELVTHLLNIPRRTHEVIKFPDLYELYLQSLECLTDFCSDHVEGIEFPRLWKMYLDSLAQFQNFWPTANNSINTHSYPLVHEKVCCPNLEVLSIDKAYNISALCSHQLPTVYFSKLVRLKVYSCDKLRNLMSPSVGRGILNLRVLQIGACESMEEVITEEEQQGIEIVTNEPLFPLLEELYLYDLPKLRHFFMTTHADEFPFLGVVWILNFPEMEPFVQHRFVSRYTKS